MSVKIALAPVMNETSRLFFPEDFDDLVSKLAALSEQGDGVLRVAEQPGETCRDL